MYKLIFFVPDSHVETVKKAIFAAGAGAMGHYKDCCWQVLGQGQFKPINQANPTIGTLNQLTTVAEWRVETVLPKDKLACVIKTFKEAHPYEHPAFDVIELICW